MWNNRRVSVIFPTYNEKESIREAIEDFFATGYVDEIIVVNNNAREGTDREVGKTRAIQVFERKQGYGYAIRRGFEEATSDLIVLCEPDGTFEAADILKLLVYSDSFDAVWGTRTNIALIEQGANMGMFMRCGNVAAAKVMQNLYNTSRLTDVGCTYKLFKKEVIEKIKDKFNVGSQHFGPELMLLTILNGFSFVEIPVNYYKRVGKSSVTGHKSKTFILAIKMLNLIMVYFFRNLFVRKRKK
ncbi:MAG: glycosyltransferase family 2 protein [Candidatus Omnitrophota bacterium]|nr:glycosyltransferase family 2 protein [Candidatus Omnitrophota bacterium]